VSGEYAMVGYSVVTVSETDRKSLIYLSISHSSEPFNNGSTNQHALWVQDSGEPKESCIVIFRFQYSHITAMQEYPIVFW